MPNAHRGEPAAALLTLYRGWTAPDLRLLRRAFLLDAACAPGEGVAFCRERIAAIDQVLAERQARMGQHD